MPAQMYATNLNKASFRQQTKRAANTKTKFVWQSEANPL